MEIELKLLLDPGDVAAFRRLPMLRRQALAKPAVQQLTSIYFDTPDCFFWRNETALRVRRVKRGWVQCLKGGGKVEAGLHQRQEWEARVAGPRPDLAALIALIGPDTDWSGLLSGPALGGQIAPIFTTRVRRTVWQLRLESSDEIELALDQGEISREAEGVPICEVELELKSGDPARLFDFALQLQQVVPLRVGNISKAERGYALVAPRPFQVVKAAELELARNASVEQGFLAIVGNCLLQIEGNESGVVRGSDAESVHQMRVGVRRLRCALKLFARVAPIPAGVRDEIEWLAGELGPTRDWEVLAGGTLAALVQARPDQAELGPLQQAAGALAAQSRRRTARTVDSVRYARLLLSIGAWIHGKRWREAAAPEVRQELDAPLSDFAGQLLLRCHGKLGKRGKRLREREARTAPEARHRMRIAAKQVRYAAEFFQSLYPARRVRPYVKALTELQELLGALNDMDVACRMLEPLAKRRPELAYGAGFVRGYLAARSEPEVRRLRKVWRRFKSAKLPYRR